MGRLLLVGNSRWHWAERRADGLRVWHEPGPPACIAESTEAWDHLEAWACVGHWPAGLPLPPRRPLGLEQVPLQALPPWLGIDRALAGWRAWQLQGGGAVLVADAGTCLSLTWIDGNGRFRGGRLSAGLALQLRSLAQGTAGLPLPEAGTAGPASPAADPWPADTAAAMEQGCLKACTAAVGQGWQELQAGGQPCRLWLTGGDGGLLLPELRAAGLEPRLAPDLVLEGLAALAGVS